MSLAALAEDDILRTDRARLNLSPIIDTHLTEIAATLNLTPAATLAMREALKPVAAASPVDKSNGSDSLDGLVKYIPTESITLYIAAVAALPSFSQISSLIDEWFLYLIFVALTPILFILIYVGKRRGQSLSPLPDEIGKWPWWKLIAATIAFAVWALAAPPLVTSPGGKVAAAFGALLISTFLSLLGAVFEPAES